MIKAQTLKGFRDFLPETARKRAFVLAKVTETFELFGFDPLETPALEYAETLTGKYGNEADKLVYLFEDRGGRKVGLRYDQTVPVSRVASQYGNELPIPFKRYQVQPVWRAENPQKGRYREFLQCDIDTIGTDSPLADAEIIAATLTAMRNLGIPSPVMAINDRAIFDTLGLTKAEIIAIDKLDKIGREAVLAELTALGRTDATEVFRALATSKPSERLAQVIAALTDMGFENGADFRVDPFLARGLDYYTSVIFELKCESYRVGSLAGGGRYDKLIGQFTGRDMPAVGIAFGFDRIVELADSLGLVPAAKTGTQVLVTVFSEELVARSVAVAAMLRNAGINTELGLTALGKLDKQLKYADRKGIPVAVIIGPEEATTQSAQVKYLATRNTKMVPLATLADVIGKQFPDACCGCCVGCESCS